MKRSCNRHVSLLFTLVLLAGTAVVVQPVLGVAPSEQSGGRPGTLVVVGGGGTPRDVIEFAIELAGGPDAAIVVLPQASATEAAGDSTVRMFEEAGARNVANWRWPGSPGTEDLAGPWPSVDEAAAAIREAALIWFPGGGQARLKNALDDAGLTDLVRARHVAGAMVGGTSAGAAVMAAVMITGEEYDLEGVIVGSTHTTEGLGIWPGALIDQHFLKRQRNNRLLAAVLDHPDLIGVGIDERTAVIVEGDDLRVMGESSVVVFDARRAAVGEYPPGAPAAATGMQLHVLTRGMRLVLGG